MVGVIGMKEKLSKVKHYIDPTNINSYTFIPVHAWSHSYEDVLEIVNSLSNDYFDIVLPSEMLRRIRLNVKF
jgi:hypothetical protein